MEPNEIQNQVHVNMDAAINAGQDVADSKVKPQVSSRTTHW